MATQKPKLTVDLFKKLRDKVGDELADFFKAHTAAEENVADAVVNDAVTDVEKKTDEPS